MKVKVTHWDRIRYGSQAEKVCRDVENIINDLEEIHKHTCPECKQSRHMDGCSVGENVNQV